MDLQKILASKQRKIYGMMYCSSSPRPVPWIIKKLRCQNNEAQLFINVGFDENNVHIFTRSLKMIVM